MQRPAAEGRKAGAEDHAGIDVIGIGYDLVGKGALAFVEHWLDQLATETIELSVVVFRLAALGLAVLPNVKALAGLLAELAGADQPRQWIVLRCTGAKLGSDLIGDVEADQVHELERPHRHTEFERGLIDLVARRAFRVTAHGLHHVRGQHAIDEEAGATLNDQRQLLDGGDESCRLAHLLLTRTFPAHNLDQRKLRDRIEEMDADEPAWLLQRLGDVLDAER